MLNDPLLQSLEARLAGSVPQISSEAQRRMLYNCAFAAGQRTSVIMLRRWQFTSVALTLMAVGLGVSQFNNPVQDFGPKGDGFTAPPFGPESGSGGNPGASHSDGPPPPMASVRDPREDFWADRKPAVVPLDAWQIRSDGDLSKAQTLAQSDFPSLTLTVGSRSRLLME